MSSVDKTGGGEGASDSRTETHGPPAVRTVEGSSDRTVFTEAGNTDAWIATDYVSDVQR
ncbi:hypothetical protein [Halorientalis pallida]|uniref:hypothetical protein n=1 Tax=Halorientalis pallida TaxID=2479928 RepID=UPI00187D0E2F|nr:hypothetical protein [Halorientalis pallida]